MITSDKEVGHLKPEMIAQNTWGIGSDDVMLVIKFPEEWNVKHSSRYMAESNWVYIDMTIQDARAFAANILAAANDAERIENEYRESQENDTTSK
jgi:hypothetical protein